MNTTPPKRLAGFDCDGVVSHLTDHTLAQVKIKFPDETIPDVSQLDGHSLYNSKRTPLSKRQHLFAVQLMNKLGFVQELPVMEGAKEGVAKFQAAGFEVIWITAPWLSSHTWDFDRRTWLRKNFKTPDKNVILGHRKELIGVDVFVDDKPQHVREWAERHPNGRALLFDQPWNHRNGDGLERFTWADTDRVLAELAQTRKEAV